jgi:endonuclease/exonuclease/phosphatase (EEP) superfamily protein YafD
MAHVRTAFQKRRLFPRIIGWTYSVFLVVWYFLFLIWGDGFWWLAFLNIFAPYFFVPLPFLAALGFWVKRSGYWLSLVLPLLLFIALYGRQFLPAHKSPGCPGQPSLTVVTFNRYGFSGDLTLDALQKTGLPDVLVLQESLPHQQNQTIQSLRDELPYHLFTGETGLALFSRYPVVEMPSEYLQDPRWFVLKAQVSTPSGPVVIYNVHMTTTRILGYLSDPGFIPEIIHYTAFARREMTQLLAADIAEASVPAILLGDFNSTPLNDPAMILGRTMTDAFQSAGWGFGHTFPSTQLSIGPLQSFSRMVRIDMIFVSQEFEVMGAWVGEFFGESDHLPVAAQLAWNVCENP